VITGEQPWDERVGGWLAGTGCDAWVWQREVLAPGEYAAQWLRDAGLRRGDPQWVRSYDSWLDWFAAAGVAAVGMGLVSIRRTDSATPSAVCEDLRQAVQQPAGAGIDRWFQRQDWLRSRDDEALLAERLRAAVGLVLDVQSMLGTGTRQTGWGEAYRAVRQTRDACWELEADAAVAGLLAAADGSLAIGVLLELLSAFSAAGDSPEALVDTPTRTALVRDLVQRGFLLPPA
jgi:hypothetical protein